MFASFGALIISLINPLVFQKIFKNKATRKNLSMYFIGSTMIFFVLFGITTDSIEQETELSTSESKKQTISNAKQQKNEIKPIEEESRTTNNEQPPTARASVLFDTPTLLNKNISYFIPVFGEPVNESPEPTDIAIQTGVETWTKRFDKDGYAIAVTYDIISGQVMKIFLSKGTYDMPLEETWITKNEVNDLLKSGNISRDSNNYYYRFMWPIQDRNKYTGTVVQKKPFTGLEGDQLCNGYPDC